MLRKDTFFLLLVWMGIINSLPNYLAMLFQEGNTVDDIDIKMG